MIENSNNSHSLENIYITDAELSPGELLTALGNEQVRENTSLYALPIELSTMNGLQLIDLYLKRNPLSKLRYQQAINYHLVANSGGKKAEIEQERIGVMFEDIQHDYLTRKYNGKYVILSEDKTFRFYHRLYPDKEVVSFPFEKKTLNGISVPDGIVLEAQPDGRYNIHALIETTLVDGDERFNRKYYDLLLQPKAYEHDPIKPFLRFADLWYVVLADFSGTAPYERSTAVLQRVPITFHEMGKLQKWTLLDRDDVRDGEYNNTRAQFASLADMSHQRKWHTDKEKEAAYNDLSQAFGHNALVLGSSYIADLISKYPPPEEDALR